VESKSLKFGKSTLRSHVHTYNVSERKLMNCTPAPADVDFYHRKLGDDDTCTAADKSTKIHVELLEALLLLLVFRRTGEGVRSNIFQNALDEEDYTIKSTRHYIINVWELKDPSIPVTRITDKGKECILAQAATDTNRLYTT